MFPFLQCIRAETSCWTQIRGILPLFKLTDHPVQFFLVRDLKGHFNGAGLVGRIKPRRDRRHRNLEGRQVTHDVGQQIVAVLTVDLQRAIVRGVGGIGPLGLNPAGRIMGGVDIDAFL